MTAVPTVTLHDGTEIPQFGFGVWQVPADDAERVVAKALEVGYRHIDTAAVYGNEEGVGRAIAASGIPREELYVTTKLWVSDFGRAEAKAAMETSLQKLGLDHVDLYLTHWPAPATDKYLEAWQGLQDIAEQGLSTSIGVSNHLGEHLARIAELGGRQPVINQIEVHPFLQQREVIAANEKHGIATQAWSPLAQGQVFDEAPVVAAAEAHGVSPAQVVIRWHLQQGRILFPKSVTDERIASNFDVFGFELTAEELEAIDGLEKDGRLGPNPAEFSPGS
ncbi:aldo/keto reductase [Nesterenkonia sp. HG001]|uniref:aldo/keto reductase n=1 Tax=Nesterenkonia sp. HG001 TaxID=2983207 RepID=UPI002AC7667C|nr:aldo/keto reductase [Nesterenkonia sp. HG001]MDZ5078124.1 aldo/keto reductase [Nesterenkonia sp. HG001]